MDEPENPQLGIQVNAESTRREGLIERAIRSYDASLRGFLRWKMGVDDDEVKDALQETYERLLHYRESEWEELPRSLLMRIAATVVIDRARYRASRHPWQHIPIDDISMESAEATPERRALAQENIKLVQEAIRDMPERCQEVFVLSRIKGMSYQQIAYELSISIKAVEKHVSRGLALCRKRIEASKI